MDRTLIIVTGASRGFGREISMVAVSMNIHQSTPVDFIISATNNHALQETKAKLLALGSCNVITIVCDFSFQDPELIIKSIPHPASCYKHLYLFNNAGSLGRLAHVCDQIPSEISSTIQINLTAPIILTQKFLQFTKLSTKTTISSLAAILPFESWGIYCSIKAARDMFHKSISIEHNLYSKGTNLRVLNYAPGPLDTDMQTQIRNDMPDGEIKNYFVQMHNDYKLVKVKDSAIVLMRLLHDDLYSNGDHVDYYDALDNKT